MHFFSERRPRAGAALVASATLVAGVLSSISPAHAATLAAPGSLAASTGGSSTPILSWQPVKGATAYEVQADNDPAFGTPNFKSSTANTRSVPTSHLPTGIVHWRVRATSGRDASPWTKSQVTVNPSDVPSPIYPENGSTLQQPRQQPLLRWTTSRGATSYTVQLDGDQDLIGGTSYTTKSTSFVIPKALTTGDWYWRVIANKSSSILSQPSPTVSFNIGALDVPALDTPTDTFEEVIEDVRLDWRPVPGAATYDLQVALDPDFVNYAYTATGLRGTAYSPPTTLNNDEFWWRVRAVDSAGVASPWRESQYNFKRQWLDQAQPMHPLGTSMSPGLQDMDTTYFSWTPAQHATHYQVEVADNIGFNGATRCTTSSSTTLSTASVTYVPRFNGNARDCQIPATTNPDSKIVYWWRVRPMDLPYEDPDGLSGAWSTAQAFYRTPRVVEGVAPSDEAMLSGWATGLKVSMSGHGAKAAGKGCVSTPSVGYPTSPNYVRPSVCAMGGTPVLSWDRMPGISRYVVWFAQDENFTTTEVQPFGTYNTMASLDYREKSSSNMIALPESQSGRPYYWHVQACRLDGVCSPRPDSLVVGIGGAAAFSKASPAVHNLSASASDQDDISFYWSDYLDTNATSTFYGEAGNQTAREYSVQVATDPGFANVIDSATVDQATYTAGKKLYPQGTIYWRVRAKDAQENALPWSAPASVTKSTPPTSLSAPVGGVAVSGGTPFEWAPQDFARSYTLEVYRNGDTAFSPGNRVLNVTTSAISYAPSTPLPASDTPYVWRVRKTDNSDNPGPWSPPATFRSLGTAPALVSPAQDALVRSKAALLEWSDVPGAASYVVRATNGSKSYSVETVATAWAPSALEDGRWTWTVSARDAAEQTLGVSGARDFRVDATAPKIAKVTPGKPKPTSTLAIKFSERVRGVSKSNVKLTLKGAKGKKAKVKARVKLAATGTKATIDPKGKLKRGKTYILTVKAGVTDVAGNALAPVKLSVKVK
jgi:hypothetical protein